MVPLFLYITFSSLGLLQLVVLWISTWQPLIFQNITTTPTHAPSACYGKKGKNNHTGLPVTIFTRAGVFCFQWRMQSWQRKNKTPLCQNISWRWFPSLPPLCQLHTNPGLPWAQGVFMVLLGHKHSILQNNTQSHPTSNEVVPERICCWVLTSDALSEITLFPLKIDKLKQIEECSKAV